MKIYNFKQGSEEWFNVRVLKGTASKATAIINCGTGLNTLCLDLVSEYLSMNKKEEYTNEDLNRGKELEKYARFVYEINEDLKVDEVGFIEYNEYIGCSPDGLINKDGILEIKCPSDKVYFDALINKIYKKDYFNQIQMQLLITGRNWGDLFFYNPNFSVNYVKFRILPCEDTRNKLLKGFELLELKIKEILAEYEKTADYKND